MIATRKQRLAVAAA